MGLEGGGVRSFAAGAAASLGVVALLNARVLMLAAGYHRLPAHYRDGKLAAAAVEACLVEHEREGWR